MSIRYSSAPIARMSWSGVAEPCAMTCESRTWPSKLTRTSDGLMAPSAIPLRCASATASDSFAVIEVATSGSSGPPDSRSVRVAPSTHWPTT